MKHLSTAQINHCRALQDEIETLRQLLRPHDTGHIHTTINTLEWRLRVIRGEEESWIQ